MSRKEVNTPSIVLKSDYLIQTVSIIDKLQKEKNQNDLATLFLEFRNAERQW
jgi:hypothetical protein